METLYSSDTIQVLLNRGRPASAPPADPGFVTFEGIGLKVRREPFADSLAGKYGIDIVHVVPRAPEWYHYHDMDACLARVRDVIGPSTIAYGSSMGAYAVAHFAGRLGVERGICFSPQVSIQQRVVPFEKRWQNYAAEIEFLHDDTIAPHHAKLWVFVDTEFEAEIEHARRIAASGPHEIIGVPNAGHPVGPALLEGGVLSPLMRMFLERREDAAAIREMIATSVRVSSPTILVQQANGRRPRERLALLREALAMDESHAKARLTLGLLLLRLGETDEGHAVLRPLPIGRNARMSAKYSKICDRFGIEPVLLEADGRARSRPDDSLRQERGKGKLRVAKQHS